MPTMNSLPETRISKLDCGVMRAYLRQIFALSIVGGLCGRAMIWRQHYSRDGSASAVNYRSLVESFKNNILCVFLHTKEYFSIHFSRGIGHISRYFKALSGFFLCKTVPIRAQTSHGVAKIRGIAARDFPAWGSLTERVVQRVGGAIRAIFICDIASETDVGSRA